MNQSLCETLVRDPFVFGIAPARGLLLRWDLIAIARRVLAARDGLDPLAPPTLLAPGARFAPDALPVSDLTRKVVHFLKGEGDPTG
jgi:hypothetical protein